MAALGDFDEALGAGAAEEPLQFKELVGNDVGAFGGVVGGEELVAQFGIGEELEAEDFDEDAGGDVAIFQVLDNSRRAAQVGEAIALQRGGHTEPELFEQVLVGAVDVQGAERGASVEQVFIGGQLFDDLGTAEALQDDGVGAVVELDVLHDLAEADDGADGGTAVVFVLPLVAAEGGHGELLWAVECVGDELFVAWLEDSEGHDAVGHEHGSAEREE